MKISEVFATVQGEGMLLGVPSLFIRVSGCNLRCVWCDTPYTSWQPEGEQWSVEKLLKWTTGQESYRHVVLTGGEPMLFGESVEFTSRLRALGYHITIETAGTVWQPVACDLMSVSPKLSNSTPWQRDPQWAQRHEEVRLQWDVLKKLNDHFSCQWKFVVANPADLEEVEAVATRIGVASGQIVLMPEGTEVQLLTERSQWLVEACKSRGYRFSPRLHVLLWGNRRGV